MSSSTTFSNISKGDDRTVLLQAVDAAGDPVDLTGAVLRVVITTPTGTSVIDSKSTDPTPRIELGNVPTNGDYKLVLSDEDTVELDVAQYYVEAKAKLSDDRIVTLLRRASFTIDYSNIGNTVA